MSQLDLFLLMMKPVFKYIQNNYATEYSCLVDMFIITVLQKKKDDYFCSYNIHVQLVFMGSHFQVDLKFGNVGFSEQGEKPGFS